MAEVIAIFNHKGGVGKTTLTRGFGLELARRGKRVLFIDSDPQGNLSSSVQVREEDGLYNLLLKKADWRDVLRIVDASVYGGGGMVGIVPSSKASRAIGEELVNVFRLELLLRQVRRLWDYVLIDTPPTPSKLHSTILVAADGVFIPTETEGFSINQMVKTLGDIREADESRQEMGLGSLGVMGIIPNRFSASKSLHRQNYQGLINHFGEQVWQPVAERVAWGEANQHKKALSLVAFKSEAYQELTGMVDRLEGSYVIA